MLGIDEYKVYGPYMHEGMQRRMVALVAKEHRTSMSYARWLMTQHLGRWLTKAETVDHINGDKLDDRIENLQILSRADNNRKSAKPRTMVTLTCNYCGKKFERWKRQVNPGRSYCNRTCLTEAKKGPNGISVPK